MSDFLTRLASRALGLDAPLRPTVPTLFEAGREIEPPVVAVQDADRVYRPVNEALVDSRPKTHPVAPAVEQMPVRIETVEPVLMEPTQREAPVDTVEARTEIRSEIAHVESIPFLVESEAARPQEKAAPQRGPSIPVATQKGPAGSHRFDDMTERIGSPASQKIFDVEERTVSASPQRIADGPEMIPSVLAERSAGDTERVSSFGKERSVETGRPVIRVSIGRVEVRAVHPAPPAAAPVSPKKPRMSLDEYLRRGRR